MPYNIYKTNYGFFTVIVNTEIYTFLSNNIGGLTTILNGDALTQEGGTILDSGYLLSCYNTVFYNSTLTPEGLDPTVYNYCTAFMPITTRTPLGSITTDYQYFTIDCSTGQNRYYKERIKVDGGNPAVLYGYDSGAAFYDGENHLVDAAGPIGMCAAEWLSDRTATKIFLPIFVFNDDYSAGGTFTFTFGIRNSYASKYVFSAGTITGLQTWFTGQKPLNPPSPPSPDPFKPGGTSSPGGGHGDFSRTGDDISVPSLPTLSAVDAGFITIFKPSAGDLSSLARYMWTGLFDIDTFKKIFANPMDCILGMSIVPVNVPTSGSSVVSVGNISTGISMPKVSSQYVSVNCGTLSVNKYWDAYLDFDPYTKCEIYLPYIGIHQLAVDDIMGKDVNVVYHIDILSGACTAFIKCGTTVLYSFNGQCSCSIPITGNDWTNVVNGVLNIAGSIGSMVATGGLSAPLSVGSALKGISDIASSSSTVTSSKPSVERSGSLSGMGGMLGIQTPYLIITWPRQCMPEKQNHFIGYPAFTTATLEDLKGFNVVSHIHLENINATENEKSEIERILSEGVLF